MKIEHLGLFVADLEAAKDFYSQYFDGRRGLNTTIRGQAFPLILLTWRKGRG